MRRLNARAIATRTPTLFLDASHGKHATLGPLVTSDPTACWACWRRRRLEAAPEPRHELAIELAWDHGPEPHANTPGNTAPISPSSPPQPPAARLMPTHRQQLATLVVGEALAWLGQHRAPSCIDAIVTVGLDTPSAQREPLWRIPWCPACSSPPTAPHP
jgi:bacteriocin biosynthesis cyclodehydratase domain-containing protein